MKRTILVVAVFALVIGSLGCTTSKGGGDAVVAATAVEGVPLIPREVIFGNPQKTRVRLSADGKRIAYLAPVDGVLNVWVADAATPDKAKPVTDDKKRGIRSFYWAYNPRYLLYIQDKDGDENFHLYAVDVDKNEVRDLTPFEGVRARITHVSPDHPDALLIGLNKRDKRLHDVLRVSIETGELEEVERNETGVAGYLADDQFNVILAVQFAPTGGMDVLRKEGDAWVKAISVGMEDGLTTSPMELSADGKKLYMSDSRERDTAALVVWDMEKNTFETRASDERADLEDALFHPTEKTLQAVAFNYERRSWKFFDDAVKSDFAVLEKVDRGDFHVVSRTLDDATWVVAYVADNGPVKYYRYERADQKATFLLADRPELEKQPLAEMHPVVIDARDGLKLVSYYTLPPAIDDNGKAKQPVPLVLLVHGGPWGRDRWGFHPQHQWLANRGYAVLSVNFRASTGFGKKFLNAGNMEWAGKTHDDLLDAVKWAVAEGIALPDRVAIMGGSFGGYATLVGLTYTPEAFTCGVDIVGPSNLVTLLDNMPPYWMPIAPMLVSRMGDHRTEEGRKYLESRSPLFKADAIVRPLLIGQGANDPRVTQVESDQIVSAMKAKEIPVTYVLYADEGHGFRPENNKSFNAITEAFLAGCLGGRAQSVGEDFSGANFTVPEGAEHVPGLVEALGTASTPEG